MKMRETILATTLGLGLVFATGCASSRYAQSTGEYIDSRSLNTKIKTALLTDDQVKGTDVDVNVWKSVVQLTGFVESEEEKQRAEQIVWSTPGVQGVFNNIQLKTEATTAMGGPAGPEAGSAAQTDDPQLRFAQVMANPSYYYGSTIQLEGSVDTILAEDAFTISTPNLNEDQLLIMARPESVQNLTPGDVVRIEGRFQEFEAEKVEQRLNVPLDDEKFSTFENKPAVFATDVSSQSRQDNRSEAPVTEPPANTVED